MAGTIDAGMPMRGSAGVGAVKVVRGGAACVTVSGVLLSLKFDNRMFPVKLVVEAKLP